jgi:hypothetical protein
MAFYQLPAAKVPRNALLDFSQVDSGIDAAVKGHNQGYDNETNRLLGAALKTGDYGAAAGVAAERGNPDAALKLTQYQESRADRAEDREWRLAERVGNVANAALQSGDPNALASAHGEVLRLMGKDADRLDPAVRNDPKAFLTLAAHKAGKYIDPLAQRLKGLQLEKAELDIAESRRKLASGGGEIKQHEGKFYRVQPDGTVTLLPVQGQPQGAPSEDLQGPYKDPKQMADVEEGLRKEFSGHAKDYVTVRDSYRTMDTVARNATKLPDSDPRKTAGDMAMIFSFMKVLDPNSVVRETEYATAQNAAGVPEQVRNLYNRVQTGERLSPEQRADFLNQAKNIYDARGKGYKSLRGQYEGIAKNKRVNPRNVILDFEDDAAPQGAERLDMGAVQGRGSQPMVDKTPLTAEQAANLPPGTPFYTTDGRLMVKK